MGHSNSEVIDNLNEFNTKGFKIREATLKIGDEIMMFKNAKLSIKMDVEGHEISTLKGLRSNLTNNRAYYY